MKLKITIYSVILLIVLLILNVTFILYQYNKTAFIILWLLFFYAFVFEHIHSNKLESYSMLSSALLYTIFNFLLFAPIYVILAAMHGFLEETFPQELTRAYLAIASRTPLQLIITIILVVGIYIVHKKLDKKRRKSRKTHLEY